MDTLFLGLALVFIVSYLWYVSLVKKYRAVLDALSSMEVSLNKRLEPLTALLAQTPGMAAPLAAEPLSAKGAEACSEAADPAKTAAAIQNSPLEPQLVELAARIRALASQHAQAWLPLMPPKSSIAPAEVSAYLESVEQVNQHLAAWFASISRLEMSRLAIATEPPSWQPFGQGSPLEHSDVDEAEPPMAASARYYNAAVLELNTAVEIFPGSIIAAIAGIKRMPEYAAFKAGVAAEHATR